MNISNALVDSLWMEKRLTDILLWSEIRARHDFDAQIVLDFPNEFKGIADMKMRVLHRGKISQYESPPG